MAASCFIFSCPRWMQDFTDGFHCQTPFPHGRCCCCFQAFSYQRTASVRDQSSANKSILVLFVDEIIFSSFTCATPTTGFGTIGVAIMLLLLLWWWWWWWWWRLLSFATTTTSHRLLLISIGRRSAAAASFSTSGDGRRGRRPVPIG